MGIVKMYHKGMLQDTEWNMNKFSQWYEWTNLYLPHHLEVMWKSILNYLVLLQEQ